NADLLINGRNVMRERPGDTISYVHIELETPDAVIAEGAASETYVNDGNRRQFENWATYGLLYGEDHPSSRDASGLVSHRYPHADTARLKDVRAAVDARAASAVEAAA
ncbi:MAG: Hint domain-containing protein, partial [Beijerinckiaceae bacterium]